MDSVSDQIPARGNVIAGLFRNRDQAELAIDDLRAAGFQDRQIDTTEGEDVTGRNQGGFLETLGRLFGTEDRSNSDQLYSTLIDMGITEEQARYFGSRLGEDVELVTVHADGRWADAIAILERHGADTGVNIKPPISSTAAGTVAETNVAATGVTPPAVPQTTAPVTGDVPQRIELREEKLRVDKERVNIGEVNIRKEVITENQTVQVPTTREELVIERHAVEPHRPASDPNFSKSEEIHVPLTEERVIVETQPEVVEEVLIDKRKIQQNQEVSETVRREEVTVDNEGQVDLLDKKPAQGDLPRDRRID